MLRASPTTYIFKIQTGFLYIKHRDAIASQPMRC